MTLDEFSMNASYGRGRALGALRRGEVRPSQHDMRRLVIRWPGYDWQCEEHRGWYTAELIDASAQPELKNLLVSHLARTKGHQGHRSHRAAAVAALAKRGYAPARDALYACFLAADDLRLGDEIVEVDGLSGIEWILEHASDRLDSGEGWEVHWWLEHLKQSLGETAITDWMARVAERWPVAAQVIRLEEEGNRRRGKPAKPESKESFEDFREAFFVSRDRLQTKRLGVRRWTLFAPEAEVKKAWDAFLVDDDAEWLRALGRALGRRPEFAPIENVVVRALAWNGERNPFVWSLEELDDPRVRQLGFDLVAADWVVDSIGLFRKNFQNGDERFLLEAVQTLNGEFERHSAGMDFVAIPTELVHADLLVWVWDNTPCSFCRNSALRDLETIGQTPERVIGEALLDCDDDTRALARAHLNSPTSPPPGTG